MAQHEEPHVKKKDDQGVLGFDCGHHCGVQTVGNAHQMVRHCYCEECHGPKKVFPRFDPDISALSVNTDGIHPGGIT